MEDPLPPNPYKALNIAKDASLATIRSAHRKLVLTCHPDKVQDESVKQQKSEQFQQVQQAYEILSDDVRRQRYDETLKLAELRAEMINERGGSRMAPDLGVRTAASPIFEMRGGRMYEERVPNRPSYDEDAFGPKYQEFRSSSRKHDEGYFTPSSRRSSARIQDDKRKAREVEMERERTIRASQSTKATDKSAYLDRTRRRDKDRRKDVEIKSRTNLAYLEEDDSDSDATERYATSKREAAPKRRHEEVRRRDREETPRRSSKHEVVDYSDADDVDSKTLSAQDYIDKSRGASVEFSRRPTTSRAFSSFDTRQPPPPPPPPPAPPRPSMETPKRHSGRSRGGRESSPNRLSASNRRITEIVEPPTSRRPSMPGASSDPRGLKTSSSRREPARSSTVQNVPEAKRPSIRPLMRSETMPVVWPSSRRGDTMHPRSSRMKSVDIHDSGYSSPGTPEVYSESSPKIKSTKYKYQSDEDDPKSYRTVYVEPEDYSRERETSPKNRWQQERPAMASRGSPSTRTTPTRSTPYGFASETKPASRQPPPLSRAETARAPLVNRQSARGGPNLYGEISPSDDPYRNVNQSPKIRAEDVRYAAYGRRSSENTGKEGFPGFERHRPTVRT